MRASIALLVFVIVAPGASAAPWLQHGYDAARTSATPDPGPETYDLGILVQLAHVVPFGASPVILDGAVYALAGHLVTQGANVTNEPVWGVYRIDLETAEVAHLIAPRFKPQAFATDGTAFYIVDHVGVTAYPVAGGDALWEHRFERRVDGDPKANTRCPPPALAYGTLFVACHQRVAFSGPLSDTGTLRGVLFVEALDAGTGQLEWDAILDPVSGPDVSPTAEALAPVGANIAAPVVVGETLAVTLTDVSIDVRAFSIEDGTPLWRHNEPMDEAPQLDGPSNCAPALLFFPCAAIGDAAALGIGDALLLGFHDVVALAAATGEELWRVRGTQTPGSEPMLGTDGHTLVAAQPVLSAIDLETRAPHWTANPGAEAYGNELGALAVAGGRVYAQFVEPDQHVVHGYAMEDGAEVFRAALPQARYGPTSAAEGGATERGGGLAVGERVLAVVLPSGLVAIYGKVGAGIQLAGSPSSLYPAPGTQVKLDLGGSRAGAQHADLEFRVTWGDGSTTEWTPDARFEHAYVDPGGYSARVEARNPAGQTASQFVVFDVGGSPPASGVVAAVKTAFTGDAAPFLWGVVALFALATVVAVGAVARSRRAAPAPTSDRTEIYRTALAHALARDRALTSDDALMLAELRGQLGITERDHAILMQALLAAKDPRQRGLALEPGTTVLGKYEVRQQLGEGGHGLAFLARDTTLGRDVVLKVLRAGAGDPEELVREARAMGRIDHPNVVTVLDVDRVGDDVFVVLEYLEGGSLEQKLAKGPLLTGAFGALAQDLLGALEAVHAVGVVHRDVKPANILFKRDGRAKLADFGIVQGAAPEGTLAQFRTIEGAVGTIRYMSPEQAKGHRVTTKSDLYSVGLVLYEAWTGQGYFAGREDESLVELQMRVASARPFQPHADLPDALNAWFAKALAPEPGRRFASATAMSEALKAVVVR